MAIWAALAPLLAKAGSAAAGTIGSKLTSNLLNRNQQTPGFDLGQFIPSNVEIMNRIQKKPFLQNSLWQGLLSQQGMY